MYLIAQTPYGRDAPWVPPWLAAAIENHLNVLRFIAPASSAHNGALNLTYNLTFKNLDSSSPVSEGALCLSEVG
jgi:hypothetical protein